MSFYKLSLALLLFVSHLYAQNRNYSLSICTTVDYEGAKLCRDLLPQNSGIDIFIVQSQDSKYRTYYGSFSTYQEAKNIESKLSKKVQAQKPFIQTFDPDEGSFVKIEKYPSHIQKSEQENPLHVEKIKTDFDNQKFYTLSTCTTLDYEGAQICRDLLPKDSGVDIYIVQSEDKKYRTFYGIFATYEEAKNLEKNLSPKAKAQKPFVKVLKEAENSFFKVEKYSSSTPLETTTLKTPVPKQTVATVKQQKTVDESTPKIAEEIQKPKSNAIPNDELSKYENIMISVDHTTHRMFLDGYKKGCGTVHLREYVVSTGKESLEKPFGTGTITAISFSPTWYPTQKTLNYFKEKGIDLPSAVPSGSKYNYMGPVKISLSHKVNGKEIYRIHGTLNEATIGTSESGGCIRMKNKEVLELANILVNFTKVAKKSYEHIKVVLK